jgi:hypothetical protein
VHIFFRINLFSGLNFRPGLKFRQKGGGGACLLYIVDYFIVRPDLDLV